MDFKNKAEAEALLKKAVDAIYGKLNGLAKPKATQYLSQYYGSTALYATRSNVLEKVSSYTYYGGYYLGTRHYDDAYGVKIGSMYPMEEYEKELEALKEIFKGGNGDVLIEVEGQRYLLLNNCGTAWSMVGFARI